jgi:hypothetical protein
LELHHLALILAGGPEKWTNEIPCITEGRRTTPFGSNMSWHRAP